MSNLVSKVRSLGYTPLTDEGIMQLFNLFCEACYSSPDEEGVIEHYIQWLKAIGLFNHTCKYCRFSIHDITNDVYKCYNTEISVDHGIRGNFGCSKWEGRW